MPSHKRKRQRIDTNSYSINFFDINDELHKLSHSQACERFGLTLWTDSLIAMNESVENAGTRTLMHPEIMKSIAIQKKMAINEISLNGQTIYGLIARQTIKKGESIIYAAQQHTFQYAEDNPTDMYKIKLDDDSLISAQKFGNMARFMNHAPEHEDVLSLLEMSADVYNSMAKANFCSKKKRIGNLTFVVLTAINDIQPGQGLYWDYSLDYFSKLSCQIALFNKYGGVIPPTNYHWKNKILQVDILGKTYGKVELDIDGFLASNAILDFTIDNHTPPFYLSINAAYFREILQANPELFDNYFVKIPEVDLTHNCVKIFCADSQSTETQLRNYITNELQTVGTAEQINISIARFQDTESLDVPFSCKIITFYAINGPEEILTSIRNSCEQLNIACFNINATNTLYVSSSGIFMYLPSTQLADLQPPNPFLSPPRKVTSSFNPDFFTNIAAQAEHEGHAEGVNALNFDLL